MLRFPTLMHQDRRTTAPEHLLVVRSKDIKSDWTMNLLRDLKIMKHEPDAKEGLLLTRSELSWCDRNMPLSTRHYQVLRKHICLVLLATSEPPHLCILRGRAGVLGLCWQEQMGRRRDGRRKISCVGYFRRETMEWSFFYRDTWKPSLRNSLFYKKSSSQLFTCSLDQGA